MRRRLTAAIVGMVIAALVLTGVGTLTLAAVNDRMISQLGLFAIGAVIGLALFSTLLDRALQRYHDTVIAALIGLMAGSLRVLWPWPEGTADARLGAPPDGGEWVTGIVLAVVGALAVIVIGRLSRRASG